MQVESANIGKNAGWGQKNACFMVVAGALSENWLENGGMTHTSARGKIWRCIVDAIRTCRETYAIVVLMPLRSSYFRKWLIKTGDKFGVMKAYKISSVQKNF